jgi:hypothetical protein
MDLKRSIRLQAESGQAIVLLALAIVALIGIVGLAIDGGGMFFLQRDAQNAADAAAVAATYARCTTPGSTADRIAAAREAGLIAAQQNGFTDGQDGRSVSVLIPPSDGPRAGDDDYVQVNISASKPAYFIQVVYKGPLQASVRAIGYCNPPFDPATVPALFGISSVCTNVVRWAGSTADIQGGVFSNNDIQFTGSDNTIGGAVEGVNHVDSPSSNNNHFDTGQPTSPVPSQSDPLANIYKIGDYAPGGSVASTAPIYHPILQGSDSSAPNYDPDYNDGNQTWHVNNRVLEGLYYVQGDVSLGNNVTFGAAGFSVVATGQISGIAVDVSYYQYPGSTGVLFFSNETTTCGNNAIDMSGNTTEWHGLVYAPHGGVKVSGSSLALYGIIVADTITMDASNMVLHADPTILPPIPPLVKLSE